MVLVTVNMRLGPIGLLAHPLLSKESHRGISGNYMFLDMIAALQWAQRNIAVFGGNPKNVTIAGQSGGAGKVACLMASPLANRLFQKGICESGAVLYSAPVKDLESMGEKYFARLGVDKEADPLGVARALPWQKIIETESVFSKEFGRSKGIALTDPAIDGRFLTDVPVNIFRAGKQNPVSLITCANLGELTGPGNIVMPYLTPYYAGLLDGVNRVGQRGYACIFDQMPSRWKQEGCVSSHGMELGYVFGDWDNSAGWWPFLLNLNAKVAGARSLVPGLTDTDRKVSENMMAMWVQFARTGNPNVRGLIIWPAYESAKDQYLYITDSLQIKSGFSRVAQKE
jgi:para-nitrobenzyl esterase